ncbi:MAG: type VI secretion system tube protein TssD [Methylococcales bacterium]|nr:type VI secretion system tube protein Hcp [Methylococcaceae bacterium]
MKTKRLIHSMITLGILVTIQSVSGAPNPLKWPSYSNAQININGQKTGAFPIIYANAVSYSVISPRDAASGLPTGKRQHKPVTITKPMSEASPLLFNAIATNENLNSVTIQFIGTDKSLGPKIKLTNANIASFAPHSQGLIADKQTAGVVTPIFSELEDVSFTFQKIEITYGSYSAMDDWEALVN